MLQYMVSAVDNEGINAIQLLGALYSTDLQRCLKCVLQNASRKSMKNSDDDFVDEFEFDRMDEQLPNNEDSIAFPHFSFRIARFTGADLR